MARDRNTCHHIQDLLIHLLMAAAVHLAAWVIYKSAARAGISSIQITLAASACLHNTPRSSKHAQNVEARHSNIQTENVCGSVGLPVERGNTEVKVRPSSKLAVSSRVVSTYRQ